MAQDFRASQFRGAKFIASGSSAGGAKLVFYHISADSSIAPNQGNINQLMFNTSSIGTDVFMYISGTVTTGSSTDRITVFGGSTKVSGVLGFSDTVWLEKDQNASLKFFDEANPAGLSLSELYGISELDITVTDGDTVVNVEPAVDGQALYLKGKGSDAFGGTAGIAFLQGGRGYAAADGGDTYVDGGTTVAATQGKVKLATVYGSEVIISRTGTPVTVSGSAKFGAGLSGSLTKLVDGSSYLVAGANTTITTQSNGSVVIASTGGGGGSGGSLQAAYLSGSSIGLILASGTLRLSGSVGTASSSLTIQATDTSRGAIDIMNDSGTTNSINIFGSSNSFGSGAGIVLRSWASTSSKLAWQAVSGPTRITYAANNHAEIFYDDNTNELVLLTQQDTNQGVTLRDGGAYGGELVRTVNAFGAGGGLVYLLPNKPVGIVMNSGSLRQSGSAIFYNGLSGSHTSLKDGTSYLRAGSNVTITTQSNGSIEIAASGGSSSPQWVEANVGGPALRTTASVAIGAGSIFASDTGVDVRFYVSGSRSNAISATSVMAVLPDTVFSGSVFFKQNSSLTEQGMRFISSSGATTARMRVDTTALAPLAALLISMEEPTGITLYGGGARNHFDAGINVFADGSSQVAATYGVDNAFYVSGAIGSKGSATRGTAVFGGDLHVSGNLTFGGGFRTVLASSGPATLTISDRVINANAAASNFLIGLPNPALIQPGLGLLIKKTDTGTNTISLTRFASEEIEGVAATFLLPGSAGTGRPAWMVYSDGTNWWVV